MVPAVRDPSSNCVEERGCDWEKVTVCAFDQAAAMHSNTTALQVAFLVCMDEKIGVTAIGAAKQCAASTALDFDQINTCFGGTRGDDLLEAASKVWNTAFPKRTTIPHTLLMNDEGVLDVSPSLDALTKALCRHGSTSPACASRACEV